MIILYDDNGRILQRVKAPDDEASLYEGGGLNVLTHSGPLSEDSFVLNGVVVTRTSRPTLFHRWDWASHSWGENVPAARQSKYAEINAIVINRREAPVAFDGAVFDSDSVAKERITALVLRGLRGGPLPTGWVGWRDRDNVLRWSALPWVLIQAKLSGLAQAIEDREQALLLNAWSLKQAVFLAQSVADVLAVDTSAGWPA